MKIKKKVVYKSVKFSIFISLIMFILYSIYTFNSYIKKEQELFQSRVASTNSKIYNYENFLLSIADGFNEFKLNKNIKRNLSSYYHIHGKENKEIALVRDYLNSLSITKNSEHAQTTLFARDFSTETLVYSIELNENYDNTVFFSKEHCVRFKLCLSHSFNGSNIYISRIHDSQLNGESSISIYIKIENTDIDIGLNLKMSDEVIFDQKYQVFHNDNMDYVEIYGNNYEFLPSVTNIDLFSKSVANYYIVYKQGFFSYSYDMLPLFLLNMIFLMVITYNYLIFKEQNELFMINKDSLIKDELTGAYNRFYFNSDLFRELSNTGVVLYLDGNSIKKVNDNYGHDYGDQAIKVIFEAIKESVRSKDSIIRVGGDEFVVLLPECKPINVDKVIEQIKNKIEELSGIRLPFLNEKLSASFGFSEFNDKKDIYIKIKEADIKMLKAKEKEKSINVK